MTMMVTYYVADNLLKRLYWKTRRKLLAWGIHSHH